MAITVEQLRALIESLSDDVTIGLVVNLSESVDELTNVELLDAVMGDDGTPRIAVRVDMDDGYDDEELDDEDDEDDEESDYD